MNFLRIAARISTRTNTLLEVERAFDSKGAYPPFMKQTPGSNSYRGDVGKGYEFEVIDIDIDPTMSPKITSKGKDVWVYKLPGGKTPENVNVRDVLSEAVDKVIKVIGTTSPGSFAPHNGEFGGHSYQLKDYSYDGSTYNEKIDIMLDGNFELDVSTTPSGSDFHKFIVSGVDITEDANKQDWGAAANRMLIESFDPTEYFTLVGGAVENAAWVKLQKFMVENSLKEGEFFDWIRANGHSVDNGEVVLKI